MNQNSERSGEYTPSETSAASSGMHRGNVDRPADVNNLNIRSINDLDVEAGVLPETSDDIHIQREQIEETRAHMGETIDAIKEKLSPSTLIAEAKESLSEAASETAHQVTEAVVDKAKSVAATATEAVHTATDYVSEKVAPVMETAKEKLAPVMETARHAGSTAKDAGGAVVETIRMNPLPAALIGIGIGWLFMSARRQHSDHHAVPNRPFDSYEGYDGNSDLYRNAQRETGRLTAYNDTGDSPTAKVKESLHQAGESVSHLARDTKEKVTDLAHGAKDKVSDIAVATKDKASATYSSLDTWVHDNPLAAGACALLFGAAVGLAIPATRKENEWFGPTRDELAHKAAEKAHDVVDKVQHVAQAAVGTAKTVMSDATNQIKNEVKEEARSQGLTAVA